jgi:hypothetical protein
MTPCSPLSFNRHFGGTYRLHLQDRRNWFSKNSKQTGCLPPACLLVLLNLFLRSWRWRRYVPRKRRLKLDGLHGVISQKMILVKLTYYKAYSASPGHLYVLLQNIRKTLREETKSWCKVKRTWFGILQDVHLQRDDGVHYPAVVALACLKPVG